MASVTFKRTRVAGWILVLILICTSPVSIQPWILTSSGSLQTVWLTGKPVAGEPVIPVADLTLENGKVSILSSEGHWDSPAGWIVQQAVWSDLNHDNQPEVSLLVSRPFAPWPVDKFLPRGGRINMNHDSRGMSSHIILIHWKHNRWRELWAGSALARPVREFIIADMDGDTRQELVAREGTYQDTNPTRASTLAVWKWNGFGFDLVSRVEKPSQQINRIMTDQGDRDLILLQ